MIVRTRSLLRTQSADPFYFFIQQRSTAVYEAFLINIILPLIIVHIHVQ